MRCWRSRTTGYATIVVAEIRSAAEHLTLKVDTELASINDPEARDRLKEDLERRKEEAQDALQQTALWQQVLNDGIADLTADVDHDLRGRFRIISQHIEKEIDACDPTRQWAEIGAELENAIATAVGDNFVWAYQRAEVLAEEVARTFTEAGLEAVKMPQIDAREMGASLGEIKSLAKLESKPVGKGRKLTMGMQGSYGGVLMFGMMTSLAGLGMFNPLSIGAGVLMGRTAFRENMDNRMMRVRNEAKMNARQIHRRRLVRRQQGVTGPAQGHPAAAARPLPRHRQPDDPIAERITAGDDRLGATRGNRTQHPDPGTRASAQHPQAGQRSRGRSWRPSGAQSAREPVAHHVARLSWTSSAIAEMDGQPERE